jgi:hypothetical protein
MAWRWLWPGSRSQKPKPSQQATTSNEYSGGNLQIVYKYIMYFNQLPILGLKYVPDYFQPGECWDIWQRIWWSAKSFLLTTNMATMILTDGEEHERPRCTLVPSAALLVGQASIPSQRKAVAEFLVLEAAKRAAAVELAIQESRTNTSTAASPSRDTSPIDIGADSDSPAPPTACSAGEKRAYVEDSNDKEDVDDMHENACINPNPMGELCLM